LLEAAQEMAKKGLVVGTAGNVSLRRLKKTLADGNCWPLRPAGAAMTHLKLAT
jgi:ribulose-5-phosphate 4-epimerase/fuculose-1-phosphate aldolase